MRLESFGLPFVIATSLALGSLLPGCGQKAGDDDNSNGAKSAGGQATAGGSAGSGTGGNATGGSGNTGTGGSGGAGGSSGSSSGATGGTGAGGTAGATTGGSAGAGMSAGGSSGASTGGASGNGAAGMGMGGMLGGAGHGNGGASAGGSAGMAGSAGAPAGGCTDPMDFTNWGSGKGPADIGPLAVNNFKSHTGDDYGGAGYALTFTWFGALVFAETTGDTANEQALIQGFEPYATGAKTVDNSTSATVDSRAFGTLPLEIYMDNMDARCLTLGVARADVQWMNTTSDGITKDARYWADDMFMITGLQIRAYRATKDTKYRDHAAKAMIAYLAALQQSDGLFWHTKQSHAYWGRANGWVASGMTELLLDLPAGSDRDSIMAGYKKMMDGLLAVQISSGNDDGAWLQVLNDPTRAKVEMSCTAMFTFALVSGVRNGWLTDPKYAAAARKGWLAVGTKTNSTGQLSQVCPGTGQADAGTLDQQQQFYENITFGANDMHGQAPLLWTANALLRKDCPGVR
jgi:unsaturated rhamnogalacturonyl hydrolase